MVEVVRHDIVIVGGGGAGIRAAIAAVEADPKVTVALVSKVYPMRSHTVSAEGGAAAVVPGSDDSLDKHAYDTVKGSDFLADQDVVDYFVEQAPLELTRLEHWGCPWSRNDDGSVATRPFGGMQIPRTWYAADKVGFHMLHTLFQHCMRFDRIVRYDEYFVTKLLVDGGAVKGVAALDMREGKTRVVLGRAVILATGGAGKCFPFTTNGTIKTGDGMALAYRAGVGLKDMEFVQYHPTGLPGTGILITEASRGEGGYLINSEGERFLVTRDYGVGQKAELGPRDMISRAIMQEISAGRGIKGAYGEHVQLDLRHLGEAKIMKRLPFVRELSKTYAGVDPVHQPIPIRPVVHYMMGGVDTNVTGATDLPGLYAAGECASVSLNGANRLGSNSLTECLVFGARAAIEALKYARGTSEGNETALRRQGEEEMARIDALRGRKKGGERISQIRREMNLAMERGCGVYRDQASMQQTVAEVAQLKGRYADLALEDSSKVFNTEILTALELGNMLDVAETIAVAALARQESRGAHACRDYPTRNDQKFLHHLLVFFTPAGPRLEKKAVTITRFQPEERKY
ncbi:MAG TPA: succinate dehydrogenase/fumarate reductase flavoprotein subunit [Deltaproteobacteria bacterium]|nr:succinate dehydrogenase/fumarate reductase flavoprotein subunit [Deltaproteobacteria bacterium]